MHLQTAKIEKVIQETHNTRTLRLRLERPMPFKCGQFVIVNAHVDGKTEHRAFSISSSPTQDFLDITVKVYPPGKVSPFLYGLAEGANLKIKGPYGEFIFDESRDAVLIGGGSGIAPLMAMIRYCSDKKLGTKLLLIYGVRTPKDLIFENELKELERKHRAQCVFTVEQPDNGWHSDTGRMNMELIKRHVKDFSSPLFYICGPPAMADLVENGLQEMGVNKEKIKTDKWF